MRGGKLKHQITIQQKNKINNAIGASDITWSSFATNIRANVMPIGSKEFFAQDQEKSTISHKIFIRHINGVTADMRAVMGSRVFEFTSPPINVDEANKELVIMAKERV